MPRTSIRAIGSASVQLPSLFFIIPAKAGIHLQRFPVRQLQERPSPSAKTMKGALAFDKEDEDDSGSPTSLALIP
ncbi:hypothetical protein NOVOSPHI9U_420419 [Novosphingobium sp. 9U]|nr:hypothetical protein NOVOSPHI9U_420419 [Novosphingobium sp. 9U]